MKRTFILLFIIGILCVSFSWQVSASGNYYTEGYYKYTMDSDSVTIISYYGSESEVVIPDHIAALPVTRIESSTFAGNKTVKNVTIPETVTDIDDDLFSEMDQLKKVIVQSKSITVKVPKRCVVVEDYPVYVTEGTDNKSEDAGNVDEGTENKSESDENDVSGTVEKLEVAGDNLEEIGNNERKNPGNLQDRPGIITENNKLITVDDTGNLVEIDAECNVKIIDREHKYTVKEDVDGEVIITDENDNKVSIEKDGKVKPAADVKEEAIGNESENTADDNQDVVYEDNQDVVFEDNTEKESGNYHIVVVVMIIVLFAGAGLVIWIRVIRSKIRRRTK